MLSDTSGVMATSVEFNVTENIHATLNFASSIKLTFRNSNVNNNNVMASYVMVMAKLGNL